jgi:hypothetical protein
MLVYATQRVGVAALGATGVEQEIVKIPQNQIAVTLRSSEVAVAARFDLEKDMALEQQPQKLDPRKTILHTKLFDSVRSRQRHQGGTDLRIAKPEQCARARRFQDDLVPAATHVGKPRHRQNVGVAQSRRTRPVFSNQRLDDDMILVSSRSANWVLHQAEPGQSLDQRGSLFVGAPRAGRKRRERETGVERLGSLHYICAERAQVDRLTVKVSDDRSAWVRFEAGVAAKADVKNCRRRAPLSPSAPGAQAAILTCGGGTV